MSAGPDLKVLTQAFEQCQSSFRSRGGAIAALGPRLMSGYSDLGNRDVAGDDAGSRAQLQDGLRQLADAMQRIGAGECEDFARGIQQVLDLFAEIDRRQAAHPELRH